MPLYIKIMQLLLQKGRRFLVIESVSDSLIFFGEQDM